MKGDFTRDTFHPYHRAQQAIADLKAAIHQLLTLAADPGLTNAEIGRTLGIYTGHVGHEGHIPRTLLAVMEAEGVVCQDAASKRWTLKRHDFPEAEPSSTPIREPTSVA